MQHKSFADQRQIKAQTVVPNRLRAFGEKQQ
jgi:hypothetical protein